MLENVKDKHIVFFDGDCGVCNFWVQWILEKDSKDQFLFASLQSEFGQKFLSERGLNRQKFETIYLWKPQSYYLIKSNAVLQIATLLGGRYKIIGLAKYFPSYFGDHIYTIISRNRMKMANQKCYLPTEDQKKKFL